MKKLAALVLGFFGVTAWAQISNQPTGTQLLPPASTSLSFEAKAVSTGGATKVQNTGHSTFGSESATGVQTHQSMIRLEVRVRNFGTAPAQAHLDCYFLATKLPRGKRYIWNTASRDVAVEAGAEKAEMLESTQLTQTTTQTFQSSTSTNVFGNPTVTQTVGKMTSGSKVYGWIVRLMSGDRVLKVQASSSELEGIARDPAMIAKMSQP